MAPRGNQMENTELLKTLIDAITGKPDTIPDGWRTAEQWAQIAGITSGQMRRKLTDAAKAGRMQKREFLVRKGVKTLSVSHFAAEAERVSVISQGGTRHWATLSKGEKLWSGMRNERREASSQPKPSHY